MGRRFHNAYDDRDRARAYSQLEARGSFYLAFRDLPEIIAKHVSGGRALDFGCGAGRSTRFVRDLDFDVVGVDISRQMIQTARELDPKGDYRLVSADDGLAELEPGGFDLITAMFTFDNIPGDKKVPTLQTLKRLLAPAGRLVLLACRPETYVHEWTSFSTRDFPENRRAENGDVVRVVVLDMPDERPVEDILWTDEAYREVFVAAGLKLIETHLPLGRPSEPWDWVNETEISPWSIYVLSP